jgi:tRNA(His) 5'-end guanylyltransferase
LRGLITREEAQDIPIDLTAHVVPNATPAPEPTPAVEERLSPITILRISELFKQSGLDADAWRNVLSAYNVTRTHQLTAAQADEVIKHMVSIIEERDAIKTEGGAA